MVDGQNSRTILPIPDVPHVGLTTYDAKDPDTKFPPIEHAAAARGRAQCARSSCSTTSASARRSAFGGPCQTPNFEKLAARRSEVQPVPHHRAVLADAAGAADRSQPPLGGHGRHHRDRHRRARLQLGAAQQQGAARADAQAERLLHGAVRQVPRSAGLADQPDGTVRRRGRRAAAASSTSTASSAARPTSGTPHSTRARRPSSRRRRPRRATTSPRT